MSLFLNPSYNAHPSLSEFFNMLQGSNVSFKEKIFHDNSFKKTKSIEMFYFSLEIVQEYRDFTSSLAIINLFLFYQNLINVFS